MQKNVFSQSFKNPWIRAFILLSLFVILCFVWNELYFYYKGMSEYRGDIFRDGIKDAFFPFYMWYEPFKSSQFIFLASSIIYMFVLCFAFKKPSFRAVFIIAFGWLLWCVSAAYTDGLTRVIGSNGHIQTFANDLVQFNSVSDILTNYVNKQSVLDTHGQHYPPGILILMKIFSMIQFRVFLYLSSFFSILLIYQVTLKLTDRKDISLLSSALLATTSGLLIFTTIDVAPIIILLSLLLTISILNVLEKPKLYFIFLAVFSLCMLVLCSFVISLLVLIFMLYLMIERRDLISIKHVRPILWIPVLSLAFFSLLYMFFDFNIYACFRQSVEGHMEQNQSNGYDDFGRYLLRSFSNALQFLFTCGLMLVFARVNKNILFSRSFILTVILSSFSGLFFCETERSWLVLLPFACLVAAQSIYSRDKLNPVWVVILCLISSTALEVFFKNYI